MSRAPAVDDAVADPVAAALRAVLSRTPLTDIRWPSRLEAELQRELGATISRSELHLVHLLASALDENIPWTLLSQPAAEPADLDRLASLLGRNRGWNPRTSTAVVAVWAAALGIGSSEPRAPVGATADQPPTEPARSRKRPRT